MIGGNYIDANDANHGFIRTPRGKISTFDVPAAGAGNFEGTVPVSVNNRGVIAGYLTDAMESITVSSWWRVMSASRNLRLRLEG
jgi:hypothetical protein